MTDKIDEYLSAKLQACAINFDFYITKLFGNKYNLSKELSLAIQFSPLSPEQRDNLRDNLHITTNVRNFVVDFENVLSEEALRSSRYAYRVLFVPINAKRQGQADQVVEFVKSDSPLAEGLEKAYAVIKDTINSLSTNIPNYGKLVMQKIPSLVMVSLSRTHGIGMSRGYLKSKNIARLTRTS